MSSVGMEAPTSARAGQRRVQARLRKYVLGSPAGILGVTVVLVCLAVGILGPALSPRDPYAVELLDALQPPSGAHPFGTDELGRDVLSRVMVGARISLGIGLASVALALVAGTLLGAVAGYVEGAADSIIMRFIDILLAYPSLLLALVTINILGPGLENTMVAVGVSSIPAFARLARGSMMSVKSNEFVTAARALGASHARIILRHCLPNMVAPLIVQSTLRLSTTILTAAGLSFIGLGVQPPVPEWGTMMSEGRSLLIVAPHVIMFPGIAIFLAVLGFNLLGDALRDALDPKQRD